MSIHSDTKIEKLYEFEVTVKIRLRGVSWYECDDYLRSNVGKWDIDRLDYDNERFDGRVRCEGLDKIVTGCDYIKEEREAMDTGEPRIEKLY